MSNQVLEVVVFKLAEGVSDEAFLQAAQGIEAWLETKPGFISRRLSNDGQGSWLDLVEWKSMEEAQTAAADIMAAPVGQAFG
ncbi:MAG: hypothetical protein AAGD96_32675, partial [Chloroflexota bacterium]